MHIYTTHIYMYTYVRTYVRTYTHTKDHTSLSHPPCVVFHTYAYINLCIYTFMQTKIHTSIRSLIAITPYLVWLCTHIHTYMHTCIHIYIRLNIRTDRHTYSARKHKANTQIFGYSIYSVSAFYSSLSTTETRVNMLL